MQDRNTNDVSTNTIDLSKKDVEENAQAVNKEIKISLTLADIKTVTKINTADSIQEKRIKTII